MNKRLLHVIVCAGALLGIAAGTFFPLGWAGRNASGTYSLPAGNPVQTKTIISSTWANSTLGDIGSELTNSLDRNGRGGMNAQLVGIAGTPAIPSYSFIGSTSAGLYRAATNDIRMSINAADLEKWTTSGVTVVPPAVANSSAITATGNGTGAGVNGTGGGTNGSGLTGAGGATNGSGVVGTGAGTGFGVLGLAAGGTAPGVSNVGVAGVGSASGTGVVGTGGGSGGSGGSFTGGAGNGHGIDVTGGTPNGPAGVFNATGGGNAITANGPVQIGSTGTPISASYRGTVSTNFGTIAAQSCISTTITVTSSAVGADCVVSLPSTITTGVSANCSIGPAGTCNIWLCNPGAAGFNTGGAATYGCRAFNP